MIEDVDSLQKLFGCSGKLGERFTLEYPREIVVEPWMSDFVKERHTQEEWDGFFGYCEAGPFKRWLILMGSMFLSVFWRLPKLPNR